MSIDVLWLFISFVLTLLIFSYIFGDNPLFRLASYAFVGVSAGYLLVTVLYQVLWPKLVAPLLTLDPLAFVPLLLGVLLLFKVVPGLARFGSIPLAYLVGVAAAVAIGGAIFGTLIGQAQGAIQEFDLRTPTAMAAGPIQLVEAVLLLLGTVATLAYFQFSARAQPGQAANRGLVVETLAQVGQFFIAITLGALFAGVFSASMTALIERLDFIQRVLFTYVIR
jgi:hypothetical protein